MRPGGGMTAQPLQPLRVEPLSPTHLAWFPQLQTVLLGDWLARVEQRFPDLLPSRSPRCFIALDADGPLAAVVVQPINRRGSCWTLQRPQQLMRESVHGLRTVQRTLLQSVLQQGDRQVGSWVIRCPAGDADAIALLRELGFQPLRPFQVWHPPANPSTPIEPLPQGLTWQPINRRNAQRLWPIEQGGCFSHLRQITDRHWLDLLDRRGPGCGVLMAGDAVLAGCLRLGEGEDQHTLELIRDVAWDPRLDQALPQLLSRLQRQSCVAGLSTALDDAPMAELLSREGWRRGAEQLLMGRSMWRRQTAPRNLQLSRPFDQVLGRLRPQGQPMPSPSLGRR